MIPERIGRYDIKRELGRGGMATVYFAFDTRFKRDVAVKVLPAQYLHEAVFRARFEREAQTIAALEHPAIVPVYDFGEEGEELYLVMRYMPNGSLSDRLRSGPLSVAETAALISRLAPALDEVHSHGIVHRDLKPANILFDQYGNAYLSDFGIARAAEGATTLTGDSIIGTPAYMSPEQALGEAHIDGRSDIYSLGAIVFEMLAGKQPYQATTPMGVAMKHITAPAPRILEVKADLPQDCEELILRAMAKERGKRFSRASELAEALNAMLITPANKVEAIPPSMAPTRSVEPSPADSPPSPPSSAGEPAQPASGASAPAVPASAPAQIPPAQEAALEPAVPLPALPAARPPGEPVSAQTKPPARKTGMPLWAWVSGCLVVSLVCVALAAGTGMLGSQLNLFGARNTPESTPTQAAILASGTPETIVGTPVLTPTLSTRPESLATLRPIQVTGSGKILFQDDFSDPSSGWERDIGENLSADYYYGNYRILINEPFYIVWGLLNLKVADVIVDTEVTKASGPDENFFGIICRYLDKDNHYFLMIGSDGYYAIGKMKAGEEILIGEPGYSDAIHQGNTTNRLRAECVNNTLSLFANNLRLAQVTDSDFASGAIGLMGRTYRMHGTDLLFDNVLITKP